MNLPLDHIGRIRALAPKDTAFRRAEERFKSLVKRPLESDMTCELLRYFAVHRKWDNREYVIPVAKDLEFLNEARQRFQGTRFEDLYATWRSGRVNERDLRAELGRLAPERTVFFETCLVNGHRTPLAVDGRHG